MDNIIELFPKNKSRKIVGRGPAGKGGKTAGRGHKGQKSRSGFNMPLGFEGGQSTLVARTPKARGKRPFKLTTLIINYKKCAHKLDKMSEVSKDILLQAGVIKKSELGLKIKLSQTPKTFLQTHKLHDVTVIKAQNDRKS